MSPELRQYLETILAITEDDDEVPLEDNFNVRNFSDESIEKAELDLQRFIELADEAVQVQEDREQETMEYEPRDFTPRDLAHDFWMTRNRYGVGFWDKEEKYGERLAEAFTDLAHQFGEVDVSISRRVIYLEGGRTPDRFGGFGVRKYPFQTKVDVAVQGGNKQATAVMDLGAFWITKVRWQDLPREPGETLQNPRKARAWRVSDGFSISHKATGRKLGPRFATLEAALVAWDEFAETCPYVAGGGDVGTEVSRSHGEWKAYAELIERWKARGTTLP